MLLPVRLRLALMIVAILHAAGCTKHTLVDTLMWTAHRPPAPLPVPGFQVLAGDTHCHIVPPDSPGHVSRGFERTVELARRERLDFVVLTPHLWDEFHRLPYERDEAIAGDALLLRQVAALPHGPDDPLVIVGFEYTTRHGHATAAFGDLVGTLRDVPWDAPDGRFFERYVETGGLLFINHPFLTPSSDVIGRGGWDLSWKHWTRAERVDPELRVIERLAHGVEVFNLGVDHLLDRFVRRHEHGSMRAAFNAMDRMIHRQGRPVSAVGGSDSHSDHLRASMYVLARERTGPAIREALLAGRTCVRGPPACTFEVRVPGGEFRPPGSQLPAVHRVEVRARGERIEILRDGHVVVRPRYRSIEVVPVERGRCTLLRARVDGGESGPVYVGCDLTSAGTGG